MEADRPFTTRLQQRRRFQREKNRWFFLRHGFLRFLVPSQFKFVLSGGRKIIHKHTVVKRQKKEMDDSITKRTTRLQQRRRLQQKKNFWFFLCHGFLRFLVRSKLKFVLSSSGGKAIRGKHTEGKRKNTEMDDDFVIQNLPHPFRLPHKIAEKLSPHHIEGLKWLLSLHREGRGGILADDVELEVTALLVCIFIAGLFYSNLARRVLIVTVHSLSFLWEDNLSDCGLLSHLKLNFTLRDEVFHTELQDGKSVYIGYREVMAKSTQKDAGNYEAMDYMFIDEGDHIRNPNTSLSKSLSQLCCKHCILITRTPLQNKLTELWALIEFCNPGLFGSENEFLKKYGCISRVVEENASIYEKRLGYSAAQALRKSVRPYLLRRSMSDFGILLPKKNEMVIWLKLTPIQRRMYKNFLKNMETSTENNLAALSVLKHICDHPRLVKRVADESVANLMLDASCKISFLSSLLNDLLPKGHFVLIFSHSAQMLDLIEDLLKEHGNVYARLDGKTKIQQRQKLVKDFQEGNGPNILLLTSGVGGCQLNLTKADRLILVNPAWNPCTDNQCVDRAYRIGQTKDVIVYRLITCGTIDEKAYIKQVLKEGLFRSITENKKQPRYFNTEDSKDICSLPIEEAFDSSQAALHLPKPQDHQHTMETSFQQHVEFLNTLDIAGVTHHSRLFSNTVPVQ